MSPRDYTTVGNILGMARAEADEKMLAAAFLETQDYRALCNTQDFNFIVGRRGTGKTAFCRKLRDSFSQDRHIMLEEVRPEEYHTLSLLDLLRGYSGEYRSIRAITRVGWRGALLLSIVQKLKSHYKFLKTTDHSFLSNCLSKHRELLKLSIVNRMERIIRECDIPVKQPDNIPGAIATGLDIENLQAAVTRTLEELNLMVIFLFDGLDEGWIPSAVSTGILGGLALAVCSFRDSDSRIHGELFIRDNIFRSLAVMDGDFSRHIEGSSLRLHWDEDGLFNLVANRLRVALELQNIESNVKVWNRFAKRELEGRDGFAKCLRYTLYRPRDILVLLNQACVHSMRSGRSEIVGEDIEATSRQISSDRLSDLTKEYETVFPGLDIILKAFGNTTAFRNRIELAHSLDDTIQNCSYEDERAGDLAILATGSQVIDALYGIGFIGLEDPSSNNLIFCHDGARSSISNTSQDQKLVVHPCYWKALDIKLDELVGDALLNIHDDYRTRRNPDVLDQRTRLLGQLIQELPSMPEGAEGWKDFENWVFRTIKILFSGSLINPQLHPNPACVQRRDIVATNAAERGFWKRVYDDYSTRQVVFEIKNSRELENDDFRQAFSYSGRDYGSFVAIVYRSDNDGLVEKYRNWVQEMWNQHNTLIFVIPDSFLARCARKLRNPKRRDYTEAALGKRLDTFVRSYLAIRQRSSQKRHN